MHGAYIYKLLIKALEATAPHQERRRLIDHPAAAMDSSSWINAYDNNSTTGAGGNSGFMCGYAAGLQCKDVDEQHELLVSSQMQHHLNQISMQMNMDDESALYNDVPSSNGAALGVQHAVVDVDFFLPLQYAGGVLPTSSSTSSSFRSASLSCSPESSSAQVLVAPVTGGCLQFPEVSSHIPLMVLPNDDHQYANFDFHDDTVAAMAAPGMNGMSTTVSAFKRYARHLGPRHRRLKPACGQRMFKTAISVLTKMHTAMRHQSYYYQQAAAEPLQPSGNQLQHMISERKRREKLNDSFHALKTVLPPGSKKDKTSILITAREYVNSLKSKVCELEEKNQALQAQLAQRANSDNTGEDTETKAGEKVEIQITRDDSTADQEDQVCTVKIAVIRSECVQGNMTNVVLGTLQRLKDEVGEDVTLVAMSSSDVDGEGEAPRASLTMQLKSASGAKWEEAAVREAVVKAVADALPVSRSQSTETMTAPRRGEAGRARGFDRR